MHMFVEYLDIPPIPNHLIKSSFEEIRKTCLAVYEGDQLLPDVYTAWINVNDELVSFLSQHFGEGKASAVYQVIGPDIHIHKDIGRNTACNFIVAPGGEDVETVWYDEDKTTVLHREVLLPYKWHKIDVTYNHTVVGIQTHRISLTVSF